MPRVSRYRATSTVDSRRSAASASAYRCQTTTTMNAATIAYMVAVVRNSGTTTSWCRSPRRLRTIGRATATPSPASAVQAPTTSTPSSHVGRE